MWSDWVEQTELNQSALIFVYSDYLVYYQAPKVVVSIDFGIEPATALPHQFYCLALLLGVVSALKSPRAN
jgi:hypothetical protein